VAVKHPTEDQANDPRDEHGLLLLGFLFLLGKFERQYIVGHLLALLRAMTMDNGAISETIHLCAQSTHRFATAGTRSAFGGPQGFFFLGLRQAIDFDAHGVILLDRKIFKL